MLDLTQLARAELSTQPYAWAFVDRLFAPQAAAELALKFPRDHFKTVTGYDGEKGYSYEARALISMSGTAPAFADSLSPVWQRLAAELSTPAYRGAMARLLGIDLTALPMEVNVFHYGPGAWLGPHVDLREKLATHVFYFNELWQEADGGGLSILSSADSADQIAYIPPLVGNSVVLLRSDNSWHAVSPVAKDCGRSRRSMTVTFYSPGAVSTMWPPGDQTPLHAYDELNDATAMGASRDLWTRLRGKLSAWVR